MGLSSVLLIFCYNNEPNLENFNYTGKRRAIWLGLRPWLWVQHWISWQRINYVFTRYFIERLEIYEDRKNMSFTFTPSFAKGGDLQFRLTELRINVYTNSYSLDNRLMVIYSSYGVHCLAPRCRLVLG